MMCLKESTNNLNNTYTTALLAYVFSLAGDIKTRDFLLHHLDSVASQEGEPEAPEGHHHSLVLLTHLNLSPL